jgi:RNA polymerase sigma-70 factor, ECF subfamily
VATCALSPAEISFVPATERLLSRDVPGEPRVSSKNAEMDLINRAKDGDEEAFSELFQLHKTRVYAVCLRMTKNVADAEDLTQEAFMQVFRNLKAFRGDSAFSTWLHRVAVNTVLMKMRRKKSPPTLSLDQPVNDDSFCLNAVVGKPDPNLTGAVDRIALRRAVDDLPQGCRIIYSLHEFEGYQHNEIAQMLRCSIGNSKSQLHKAKLKMRDVFFPSRDPAAPPRSDGSVESGESAQAYDAI